LGAPPTAGPGADAPNSLGLGESRERGTRENEVRWPGRDHQRKRNGRNPRSVEHSRECGIRRKGGGVRPRGEKKSSANARALLPCGTEQAGRH